MTRKARDGAVHREVLAFAIPGFVLLGLLAAVSFWVAQGVARDESIRHAVDIVEQAEELAVRPNLEAGLDSGNQQALAKLDEVVRGRILKDPVETVRLWSSDGTIVYSDRAAFIGRTYPFDERLGALRRGGTHAEVSDLSRPENQFETEYDELVEVYLPTTAADGTTYLLEVYQREASLEERSGVLLRALVPTIFGALAVLALILLLLAWRMARRLDRERQDREDLLMYAVNASEAERRRIAADLHDGVVQDLAGVSFGLSALAQSADDPKAQGQIETAALRTRKAVGSLRTLLVDIYPPNLSDAGLAAALTDLVQSLDCDVTLEIEEQLALDDRCEQSFYRIARETLQNVAKHSQADRVWLSLYRIDVQVAMIIQDDGVGFVLAEPAAGHVGLTLMQDLAAQVGGELLIESEPGRGTTITFTLDCP